MFVLILKNTTVACGFHVNIKLASITHTNKNNLLSVLTGPPHIHTGLIQACKVISHKMDTADRRKKGKDSKPVSAARLLSDIIKIFVDLQTPLYPQPKFIHYEAKVHP